MLGSSETFAHIGFYIISRKVTTNVEKQQRVAYPGTEQLKARRTGLKSTCPKKKKPRKTNKKQKQIKKRKKK